MAGLRRREIDLLEWSSFRWTENAIEIKPTKHFQAKSEDSYGRGHFKALTAWLPAKGIEGDKPIHVLRKEFGSRINAKGGIHAASSALRHADISITAQFYTDNRARVTTGFGHLFKSKPDNVVAMKEVA